MKQTVIEITGGITGQMLSSDGQEVWSTVTVIGDLIVGGRDHLMLKAQLPMGRKVKVAIAIEPEDENAG